MTDYLTGLAQSVGRPGSRRPGPLPGHAGACRPGPRSAGRSTRRRPARRSLAAYLTDDPTAVVDLRRAPTPDIDDADVRAAVNDIANPAVSAPVTLAFGDSRVRLQPRDFVAALSLRPRNGALGCTSTRTTLLGLVRRRSSPPTAALRSDATRGPGRRPAEGHPRQARRELRAGRGDGRLHRGADASPRASARPRSTAEVEKRGVHDQGRAGAEDQGAGLDLHDVLPVRRLPQHQHRPGDGAHQRHPAQAGRDASRSTTPWGSGPPRTASSRASSSRTASSRRTTAAASRSRPRRPSTRRSSPASRTSSTRRTRSTSTATRSAARPRWPGRRSTSSSPTTRPTASSSRPGSPRAAPPAQGSATVTMWSTKYWEITTSESARYNLDRAEDPRAATPRTATRTPATAASTSTSPATSTCRPTPPRTTTRSCTRRTRPPTRSSASRRAD